MKKRFHSIAIPALAAVYFFVGRLGLSLAFVNQSSTAVWPCTGLALAALLLGGYELWPAVFIGAFFVNWTTSGLILASVGIAGGNTLEALVGAYLLNRFAGGADVFKRPFNILKFLLLAAVLSTALSATIGVTTLVLAKSAEWHQFFAVWITWWLGDLVSDLIVAPLLLAWVRSAGWIEPRRAAEAALLLAAAYAAGLLVFGGWLPTAGKNYPLEFLTLPPLLWAAFRFHLRGATAVTLLLSVIAIIGTLHGLGPFATADVNGSLLLLQAFMGTMSVTALVFASIIAQRDQQEKELRLSNEKFAETNRELEQFAYIASHDLQEPLRKIITFSDRLKQNQAALGPDEKDYAERLFAAGHRMRKVIEDLLEYSRTSRKEEGFFEQVDLTGVLKDALADLEVKIAELGADVHVGPLPTVSANRAQMRHLFQNLLSNALKFSKKGVPPRISVEGEKTAGRTELRVIDNGIGFDEKYVDRIFKPFQRLHAREEYEGTGIGLSIVQKIVQNHGGSIRAQSRPGEGATFTIFLPERQG